MLSFSMSKRCVNKNPYFISPYFHCYNYFILAFIALSIYYFYFCTKTSELDNARSCLRNAFEDVNLQNFDAQWMGLNDIVNKCTRSLLENIEIKKFPNNDETKLGILPKNLDSKCDVITLGIGKDVLAEKGISKIQEKCKFLGIDPDFKESGSMYISDLKGVYVQGKISTSFVNEINETQFATFTFQDFISQFYPHKTLEYLLMDIEGVEVALMKELIDNPTKYPTICQINVEYHDPNDTNGHDFFKDMTRSVKYGPYMPFIVEPFSRFNRVFFVNFKDSYCVEKYLS